MEESKGNRIRLMVSGKELEIDELGVLSLKSRLKNFTLGSGLQQRRLKP